MQAIISVGAGKNQLPFIKYVKSKGYFVVSFDRDSNAPGRKYSDIFLNISSWDKQNAISALVSLNIRFIAVGCFSYGKALETQYAIAEFFGLPGSLPKEILELNDKIILRSRLLRSNMSKIKEKIVDKQNIDLQKGKNYILKPLMGGSSRDVYFLRDVVPPNLNDEKYILQDYVEGDDYRVSLIVQEKKIKFMKVLSRRSAYKTFLTSRLTIVDEKIELKVLKYIEKLIQSFGIHEAIMSLDIRINSKEIEIIEIDFGPSGDYFETDVCEHFFNYPFMDNYLQFIQGKNVRSDIMRGAIGEFTVFDYIYNYFDKEIIVEYKHIQSKQSQLFNNKSILIPIKNEGERVGKAYTNMDHICAIIHCCSDISIEKIHRLLFT